jgi:2-keto-4-pentenoate hydratase/2-oxohepta-3-ene-1,7-dioic acid hydratase in catechol pathway
MRIVRFSHEGTALRGQVEGDRVLELPPDPGATAPTGRVWELASLRLLPPCEPTKLIIVAQNYAAHARETGSTPPTEPNLHPVPASPVIAHGDEIVLPRGIGRVDYEGELVVVIGRPCKGVSTAEARGYIAGYTCGNDVSAREVQWGEKPAFARAKSIDTFAPLGPWLVTDLDPGNLRIETRVNGEVRQAGRTSDMVFPVEQLVAEASRWMTLLPGDCIFTGTPEGIAPLMPGDTCEVTIDGIGTLGNRVVEQT